MKTIPAALQAHLDTGATTMAFCWRLTRKDGTVMGFTDHDENLVLLGTTFSASSGFTSSQVQQSLGLNVDNLNVEGAISSVNINESDLAAGKFDDADIELFWVNWSNVAQYILISKGSLGEVKRHGIAFNAELRGQTHRLNQRTGQIYQRTCSAVLGDAKCTVNLALAAYVGTGTIDAVSQTRLITATGIQTFANDWFTKGVVTFTSGLNIGLKQEVKTHNKLTSNSSLELWQAMPFAVAIGDTFSITAGCKHDITTCSSKFSNQQNYRGFAYIPTNDILYRSASQGGTNQDGGSLGKNV